LQQYPGQSGRTKPRRHRSSAPLAEGSQESRNVRLYAGTVEPIDVTFLTDHLPTNHLPTGDQKYVASDYAISFGGNAVTAAFCWWSREVKYFRGNSSGILSTIAPMLRIVRKSLGHCCMSPDSGFRHRP
jgi:hypothetical protein